jgi:predicted RNase H-like nuclease (RuvC/YqgF family)
MSNLIEQLESELAAAQHGGNQDDIRDAAMNLSEAHCGEEITSLRAENAALAAKLSAAEAKLRAVRERLENIQYHSNMPTHKRDDAYYLRTCCVIAKEQAEAAIHELSKEGV